MFITTVFWNSDCTVNTATEPSSCTGFIISIQSFMAASEIRPSFRQYCLTLEKASSIEFINGGSSLCNFKACPAGSAGISVVCRTGEFCGTVVVENRFPQTFHLSFNRYS